MIKISIVPEVTNAAGVKLDPLTLTVASPEIAQAFLAAYTHSSAVNAGQIQGDAQWQGLADSAGAVCYSAFTEAGLQVVPAVPGAVAAQVHAELAQFKQSYPELQQQLANMQSQFEGAQQAAYAQGVADGQAQAPSPSAPAAVGGGVVINLDTDAIAAQIVKALSMATKTDPAPAPAPAPAVAQTVAGAPPAGGVTLGSGLNLGKAEPAGAAHPQAGASSSASVPSIDPSLIGDGIGVGGGFSGGGPTIAEVRSRAGRNELEKVGLPTARKKYAGGSRIYITTNSESPEWDDKLAVVANRSVDGDDLDAIAEGAKSVLTKSLHYYSET